MISWYATREELEAALQVLAARRTRIETYLDGLATFTGYCVACDDVVAMRVRDPRHRGWLDLRESFVCPGCGTNGRTRMVLAALGRELGDAPCRALMLERLTPLYAAVTARHPFVAGSEFLDEGMAPGAVGEVSGVAVTHENMLALSAADSSLDVLFHGDVLEHVPDHVAGLRECRRVLRPGGALLFTVPFFDREQHTRRARLVDGQLVHDLEPAFHGNPVSDEGSLVFVEPGWPLLQELRDVGFTRVEVGLCYDPFQGIVSNNNPYAIGHMWPVLFRAVR